MVRGTWIAAAVVIVACTGGVAEARSHRHRPRAGAELGLAELAWPDTTQSAEARVATKVYARAAGKGSRLGKLARGTRVAWTRIVATRDHCRAWIEIAPRGWVCAKDLAPSAQPPAATLVPARIVELTDQKELFGVVAAGARPFKSVRAIERGRPSRRLKGWSRVKKLGQRVTVDGVVYVETERGYLAAHDIEERRASVFEGIDVVASPPPAWPFAWVTPRTRDALVSVRSAPDGAAAVVRTLARRAIVPVLETRDRFARIGVDEWVGLAELRVARITRRPQGVVAGERWIDVDLDEQVMVAYEGDHAVYATMVSGGRGRSTPTGIHRISKKIARTRMKAPDVSLGRWDMPDVPFSMRFRKYYAVHGVYWHDSFGKPRSQGCVNLSPRDARFVFEWSHPQVPEGWMDARDYDGGTPIRLRNRRDPEPAWADYDDDPPASVVLRDGARDRGDGADNDDDDDE
ncbi:MAG TPA: L,D-transpeptidase [Kofleriaceae bacterium]|nr:L,D-transpeptidase [Kofleriaceae bacterium]